MAKDELFSGESKNIEYKVVVPDKSEKYMKTVVAFANTQGGRLVIGIDDKTHQVVGVDNDSLFQAMDALTNAISDSCEPQIIPDIGRRRLMARQSLLSRWKQEKTDHIILKPKVRRKAPIFVWLVLPDMRIRKR